MREVAESGDIDIGSVQRIESGRYRSPSPLTLKSIARVLEIPLVRIFHAAGYVSPQDILDMVHSVTESELVAEHEARELRSQAIARLIEHYGLDYTGTDLARGDPADLMATN